MAEKGIDIAPEYPKPWTDEIVQAADVVVTTGCGEVERRVLALLEELSVPASST